MGSSRDTVWLFLGSSLGYWALSSAVPTATPSSSALPRATLPISANTNLAKPSVSVFPFDRAIRILIKTSRYPASTLCDRLNYRWNCHVWCLFLLVVSNQVLQCPSTPPEPFAQLHSDISLATYELAQQRP